MKLWFAGKIMAQVFPAGHVHAKFVGCFNAQRNCSWSIDTSIGWVAVRQYPKNVFAEVDVVLASTFGYGGAQLEKLSAH